VLHINIDVWREGNILKAKAMYGLDDDLCRIHVPWWITRRDVPSIAVRTPPIHFLLFLDDFFQVNRFIDPDALSARLAAKEPVDFTSFWPLVHLFALHDHLSAALPERLKVARLDSGSFAAIGDRCVDSCLRSFAHGIADAADPARSHPS
jgi:hypothetical protein